MTTIAPHDYWNSVPTVEDSALGAGSHDDDAGASAAADSGHDLQITLRGHRRTLLKAAGALGAGFALNVLSWLPPARTKAAQARVGSEYGNCTVFSYPDNITCTGGPYGRGYCGGDGWFLQYSGTCFASGAITACNSRNAWRWKRGSTWYRCADGMQYWCGGSGFYICAWANP